MHTKQNNVQKQITRNQKKNSNKKGEIGKMCWPWKLKNY